MGALKGHEVEVIKKYPLALKHLEANRPYYAVCCGLDDRHTIPIFEKAFELSHETRLIPIAKGLDEVVDFAKAWDSDLARKEKEVPIGKEWLQDPLQTYEILRLFPQTSEWICSELAANAAANDRPVLFEGEPGTGKKTLAQEIHRLSQRGKAGAACRVLHCDSGAVQDQLVGVLQSNASGVLAPTVSSVELVEGGTLILAGIEHLQRPAQLALLELLEDPAMIFIRPGSRNRISVDVRIIATANCFLRPLLDDLFDGDLFYRLSLNYIRVPALRQQPDLVERLARKFLERLRAEPTKPMTAQPPPSQAGASAAEPFSPGALRVLKLYSWPRNIGELKSAMHYAALRAPSQIDVTHLPPWIVNAAGRAEQ